MEVGFKIVRQVLNPDQPPSTAHWVGLSRVGSEIVMDVGYVEMHKVVDQIEKAKGKAQQGQPEEDPEMHVKVFQQFGLGLDAFMRLKQNVDLIHRAMIETGHLQTGSETEH